MPPIINVMQLVHNMSGEADGVFRHIYSLCRGLNKNRFGVFFVHEGGIPQIDRKMAALPGVHCLALPLLRQEYNILPIFQLIRLLRRYRIHILHAHFVKPYIFSRIAARFSKTPVVIFRSHGVLYDTREASAAKRLVYRYGNVLSERLRPTDVFISPSSQDHKGVVTAQPHLSGKGRVIYDGADPARFFMQNSNPEPIDLPKKYFSVGVVARLTYEKGIDVFIRSIPHVMKRIDSIRCVVAGDGPMKNELISLAERLRVSHLVTFTGFKEDVRDILAALDIVVIPSLRESGPIVAYEALAMQKPIVATRVGVLDEIIPKHQVGVFFKSGDERGLAEAIILMAEDAEARADMGKRGRQLVIEKYNPTHMVRETENLYTRLCLKKPRPAQIYEGL